MNYSQIFIALILIPGWYTATSLSDGSKQARAPTPTVGIARPSETCPETKLVRDQPPKDPNADPFGFGPWFINADRTIWAGWDAASLVSRKGNKVLWIRPQGTQLKVTGRRLNGNARPLKAGIPCCYPTGFQASGLYFPAAGCWEVTAKAGRSELKFVTKVR